MCMQAGGVPKLVQVESVQELVDKLQKEAKVL